MATITLKTLLEAGVHFGHQKGKWNPKMRKYIYATKEGTHLIDLRLTVQQLKVAYGFLRETSSNGGNFLFVGTKKQAQEIIRNEARRCNAFYVANKWLGGTLTNFETIKKSINKLQELNEMKEKGIFNLLSRKEANRREKERLRLEYKLEGIKSMTELPKALIVVDPVVEEIPVKEANLVGIPIVAICDTDANPEVIDYPVPGNDDAIRSIKLFISIFADAIIEGRSKMKETLITPQQEATQFDIKKEELEAPIEVEKSGNDR